MTALTSLTLARCSITSTIPSSIGQMTALTKLDLSGNKLSGAIPSSIGQMTALTELDLSINQLTGVVPSLPFAQYVGGCHLDDPGCLGEGYWCNNFSCPLPPNSKNCSVQCH
jgi:hypothetical protein